MSKTCPICGGHGETETAPHDDYYFVMCIEAGYSWHWIREKHNNPPYTCTNCRTLFKGNKVFRYTGRFILPLDPPAIQARWWD